MKKNYLKKSISLVLTVLMLMSCWVFVAPMEADALATIDTYRKADKYGTPYWDGTDVYYSKWNSGSSYTTIKWPKNIYLDMSETLQSAGYYYTVDWQYGSNTNYRIINNGFIFGGWGLEDTSGWPANYYTMTNMFNNYNLDGSLSNGGFEQTTNSTDGDLFVGVSGLNWSGAKAVIFRTRASTNSEKVFMLGTPKATGNGTYSTSGNKPGDFGGWQEWKSSWGSKKWTSASDKYTASNDSSNWTTDCYDGTWKEIIMNIYIYDKAPLKDAIDKANSVYSGSSAYSGYATDSSDWSTFTTQRSNSSTLITTRQTTEKAVSDQTTALNNAIKALNFAANNTALVNAIKNAESIKNSVAYKSIYTVESREIFENALTAAKSSNLSSSATIYNANDYDDAGKKAAGDQTTINNLANALNTAANGLVRIYDVGYDNLFSLTDWAYSPASTGMNNGTISCDVTKGTITVTQTTESPTYCFTGHSGAGLYVMKFEPINSERQFVIKYDYNLDSGTAEPYVLAFDTNSSYDGFDSNVEINNGYGVFTVPAGCDAIHLRFGAKSATVGATMTFSNIAVYEKSVYDAYAGKYTTTRQAFSVGDTASLSYTPVREGYVFDGWYTADGTKLTSVAGLSASTTVYAHWTQKFTVTFKNYDGTVLKTVEVAPGEAAEAPSNPSKSADKNTEYAFDKWDTDFSNVQSDLTVTAVFKNKAHTIVKNYIAGNDCVNAATYTQYCQTCSVTWDEVFEDASMPALGHTYDRANPTWVVVKDQGTETEHTVKCKDCSATTTKGHNYVDNIDKPAIAGDCMKKGTLYQICDCDREKIVDTGLVNDNHQYITTTGVKAATCTTPGYTGKQVCACGNYSVDGVEVPASGHSWDETKTFLKSAADCTNDAVYYQECSVCNISAKDDTTNTGTTWTDVNSRLGHDWKETTTFLKSDADCTSDEVYYKECSRCKISSEGETNETWTKDGTAWKHNFNGDYVDKNNGTHTQKCTNTGCTAESEAVNCSYGAWSKDNAATHSHTCVKCGYTPAAEAHDWNDWTAVGGSGTSKATQTRSCKVCGRVENTECNYKVTSHKDATCEAPEITTYECSDCKHDYSVIGESAKGHNFTKEAGVKNNGNGTHSFACTNGCGEYGFDTTKNMSVPCSDWTYANTEAGKHTATCDDCGYVKTENCSGGTATCKAPAVCGFCSKAYGTTADHSFTIDPIKLDGDKHAYRCEYCKDPDLYGVAAEENATEDCSGGTATCKDYAVCDICKDSYGQYAAHKYDGKEYFDGAVKAKDATCTTQAEYYVYCSVCRDNYITTETFKYGDLLPHTFTGNTEFLYKATDAKCEVNETYYVYCSECKASSKGTAEEATFEKLDTALEHVWVNAQHNADTLTHTFTCERACGETMTASCEDAAILYGYEPSTCTEKGYDIVQCSACSHQWNINYTDALGHNYTQKIYDEAHAKSEANCDHGKEYWYDCSRCDKNAKDETDTEKYTTLTYISGEVRPHEWIKKVDDNYLASKATCLAAAKYFTSCQYEDCGKSSEEVYGVGKGTKFSSGTALNHNWVKPDDDVLDEYLATPADCVTDATYYYTCSRAAECGCTTSKGVTDETWTKENSKSSHKDATHTEYKDADCDNPGNYEYWYCSKCNKYFKDGEFKEAYVAQGETVIPKLGHSYKVVDRVEATCEKDGNAAYELCERCKTENPNNPKKVINAKGHKFTGAYYIDTVHNYHARYCSNAYCDLVNLGDTQVKTFGSVINGEQVKYQVISDPVDGDTVIGGIKCDFDIVAETDKNGVHTHTLTCECGNNQSAIIEMTKKTVAPTCTEKGYDLYTCTDEECGATWKTNYVKANNHTISATATANNDGTHSYYCTVKDCGVVVKTEKCSGGSATCKELAKCAKCGAEHGDYADHVYDEDAWTYNNDHSNTSNGTESNKCTVCEKLATRELEVAKHVMTDYGYTVPEKLVEILKADNVEIKEPTCKDEGKQISYCELCDYYKTVSVPNKSDKHVWETDESGEEVWVTKSGDCSTGIVESCKCIYCDEFKSRTVYDGHEWIVATVVRDVCDQYDYIIFKCANCNTDERFDEHYEYTDKDGVKHGYLIDGTFVDGVDYVTARNLKKVEHNYGDPVVTKKATCFEDGREERTCSKCKYVKVDVIKRDADAHNPEKWNTEGYENIIKIEAREATCTAPGNKEYFECRDCSFSMNSNDQYTIPALGHDYNADGECTRKGCNSKKADEKADGCICHKDNGFMKFIYKILRFFWKLFKINKECTCGAVHY